MTDGFGNTCDLVEPSFIPGVDSVAITGDDAMALVTLPFPITLYGQSYADATVSTNGFIAFNGGGLEYADNRDP